MPTTSSCTRVVAGLSTSTGRYGYAEGTSFAAPLVAGAAALARDVNPQLTAEQTADVIRRSAPRRRSATGWNRYTGRRRARRRPARSPWRAPTTPRTPVPALTVTPVAAGLSVRPRRARRRGPACPALRCRILPLERSTDGEDLHRHGRLEGDAGHATTRPRRPARRAGTAAPSATPLRNCATAPLGPDRRDSAGTADALAAARSQRCAPVVARVHRRAVSGRATCRDCVRVTFTAHGGRTPRVERAPHLAERAA